MLRFLSRLSSVPCPYITLRSENGCSVALSLSLSEIDVDTCITHTHVYIHIYIQDTLPSHLHLHLRPRRRAYSPLLTMTYVGGTTRKQKLVQHCPLPFYHRCFCDYTFSFSFYFYFAFEEERFWLTREVLACLCCGGGGLRLRVQ